MGQITREYLQFTQYVSLKSEKGEHSLCKEAQIVSMKKRGRHKSPLTPASQSDNFRPGGSPDQYPIQKTTRIYAIKTFTRDECVYKFVPLAKNDANGPLCLHADG